MYQSIGYDWSKREKDLLMLCSVGLSVESLSLLKGSSKIVLSGEQCKRESFHEGRLTIVLFEKVTTYSRDVSKNA